LKGWEAASLSAGFGILVHWDIFWAEDDFLTVYFRALSVGMSFIFALAVPGRDPATLVKCSILCIQPECPEHPLVPRNGHTGGIQ
jgi:hypothetical protein